MSGDGTVVDLNSERAAREQRYDGVVCPCGSAWFNAAVALRQDRTVGSYAAVTCRECGAPLTPS